MVRARARTVRRAVARRRRVVGPVRRQYRRRRQWRRHRRTDYYVLKAKYSYTHTVPAGEGSSMQFYPSPSDFTEFMNIYDNFEAYKFKSLRLSIRPLFNVAPVSGSMPPYAFAPFHKFITTGISFTECQSLNKSRIYNGTRTAIRSFVPCALGAVQYVGTDGKIATTFGKAHWAPRIEITADSIKTPHYCALASWDKVTQTGPNVNPPSPRQYEIICDAKIILYTQKLKSVH